MKLNPDKCAFGVQSGKFLGFMLTCRGIEANPEKCQAVLNMRSPKTVKEVQQLTGRLAALARFLPRIAHRSHHFFKNLRKQQEFNWTEECEKAFTELKAILSAPPILQTPEAGKPLYLYLSITDQAISSALVTEAGKQQHPVYFVSKSLQNAEVRYPKIEKLALALVTTARRLRHYFQSHTIVVRTAQPLRQILTKPELAGRLIKWSIELSEYDIQYQSRGAIKSQALADFIAELTTEEQDSENNIWTLYVDGASNSKGSGAGILIEDKHGTWFEQSLQFTFHASNNQAEYEALIAGLRLAHTMGIAHLNVKCDSLLIVQQVTVQQFSSIEHPQTNGLAEAANKIILQGLKKKLDDSKGEWAELISEVLWSYNTTEQSATKETPFRLVYGSEAMIPIEVSLQNTRTTNKSDNAQSRRAELDLIEETRDISALKQIATRRAIDRKYNKKLRQRTFSEGDLVLRKVEDIRKPQAHGKLGANWEGPFRVQKVVGKGAYKLQRLDGAILPNTWNIASLKMYYS
ncbi:uncharacterized protein [Arachis hypogaea]|uniref:uncharacterized protein n=1 Tax=Arachis hypogaea TaxID=3818 RepID=UPI003B21CEE9